MSPFPAGNAFVAGRQGGYAIAPATNCKFYLLYLFFYLLIAESFVSAVALVTVRNHVCPLFPSQTAGTGDGTTLSTATTTTAWRRATRSAAGRPAWSGGGAVWAVATAATGAAAPLTP